MEEEVRLKERAMSDQVIDELSRIRDHLVGTDEYICAAHLQMVIDTLEKRSDQPGGQR